MNEVVDSVQKLLLLTLQRRVIGGDFDQLLLELANDDRLLQHQILKQLLLLLEDLQLHLPLLVHVFDFFLKNTANEMKTRRLVQHQCLFLMRTCCGQHPGLTCFCYSAC